MIALELKFFDDCEDLVRRLVTQAMKRYSSCLGISMGLLSLIGDFTKAIRKLGNH